MGMRARVAIATGFVMSLAVAVVMAATQNYLAKYDATGGLVDSAVYESGGNVGIGTSTPAGKLDVNGTIRISAADAEVHGTSENLRIRSEDSLILQLDTNNNATGAEAFYFRKGDGASVVDISEGGHVYLNREEAELNGTAGNLRLRSEDSLVLQLDSNNNATGSEAFLFRKGNGAEPARISESGNLGVGTAAPTSKLHVAGNVTVDGNIGAKYQDVAEWVVSRDAAAAGSVVSVVADARNVVASAKIPYDTAIAGVVSTRPGIALGEKGANKVLVAQSGRVPVKADATFGPIRAGDLLVASPTPGHAMRSEPLVIGGAHIHRPGTILGKALEPLEQGRGEILMLLTLQ